VPARALDHFVATVHDLETSGAAWQRLGFQVMPRMKHLAAGSANRVIQFERSYLELLGELENMIEPYQSHYLPRFEHGEGFANLSFTSDDLGPDRSAIMAKGYDASPITSARRPVAMPDGKTLETDSDFFYVWRPGHAFMTPFLSVHRRPEAIFVPAYRVHANTVREAQGITCVSLDPAADAAFFGLMAEVEPGPTEGGFRLELARGGWVEVLDGDAVARRFGDAAPMLPTRGTGVGVAMTFTCASLAAAAKAIDPAVPVRRTADALIVPASHASGVLLELIEAA
jgi:hypothetical protein